MTTVRHFRLHSRQFVAAYVITMRPYLLFVSGISGIAGMSLVPGVPPPKALMIALASFLAYGFGQALTDCFQIDTDRLSSPYRPLTQGLITPPQVLGTSIFGLASCIAVLALFNPRNLLLGILAGTGLATYTPFKRRWWAGPWYNAWIVAILGLMAYMAASVGNILPVPAALLWTISGTFFGYANFVLAGYFKDMRADSRTRYNTLPVVFGRRTAAWVSSALALLAVLSLTVAQSLAGSHHTSTHSDTVSRGLLLASLAVTAAAQVLLHRVRRDEESHAPIALVVHGFILGLASVASAAQPEWTQSLLLFYAAFIIVLRARPSRSQI